MRESDLSADELRAMLSAYRRRKRFHRMSDGRIAALGEGRGGARRHDAGLGRVGRRVAGWRSRATDLPGVLPGSGIW
ncbi:MAG: hypothetical protein ACLTDR_01810 [Adlercreutzia equolifaciens]